MHNQSNQITFHDTIHTSKVISYYHAPITLSDQNNKTKYTQLAYIRLEPKSFHTIKVLSITWASTFPCQES